MPRFHVHDSAVRRFRDQEEEGNSMSEVLQRLDRIEQAIVLLAGGDENGNGNGYDDQDPTMSEHRRERDAQSQRLFGSDDMIVKGNLSTVDPKAHDFGSKYPRGHQVGSWHQ